MSELPMPPEKQVFYALPLRTHFRGFSIPPSAQSLLTMWRLQSLLDLLFQIKSL